MGSIEVVASASETCNRTGAARFKGQALTNTNREGGGRWAVMYSRRTYLNPDSLIHGKDLARRRPLSCRSAGPRWADCVVQRHWGRLVMCLSRHGARRRDSEGDGDKVARGPLNSKG